MTGIKRRLGVVLAGAAIALADGEAVAIAILPGAVPATATLVNFDGLAGDPGFGVGEIVGSQFAALGVTFGNATARANTNPVLLGLVANSTAPNVVLVEQGGGVTPHAPLSISFSAGVSAVGLNFGVTSTFNGFLKLEAYDSSNTLIEAAQVFNGTSGFAGVSESVAIARLDVSYRLRSDPASTMNFSIDNLAFQPVTSPVPEPGVFAMLAAGLGVVAAAASRRRRRRSGAA